MSCSVEGCEHGGRLLKGMCLVHYRRWKKHGDPLLGWRGHTGKGRRSHPMYGAWAAMINRCYNKNNSSYARYGACGVTVCDRWRDDFLFFLSDMGERPDGMTLDRIDPRGPYSPDNCRWATAVEQRSNLSPAGDQRMRKAISTGVKAYWEEWRKTHVKKPKHPPAAGPRERLCLCCGLTFVQPPVGQPRKYCSDTCRAQYYATKKASRSLEF